MLAPTARPLFRVAQYCSLLGLRRVACRSFGLRKNRALVRQQWARATQLQTIHTQQQQQQQPCPQLQFTSSPLCSGTEPQCNVPSMLVVEAFAGSHPVARHFQALQGTNTCCGTVPGLLRTPKLAAYAAVELHPNYKAPAPDMFGLTADSCLDITGSISSLEVQAQVLEFVRAQLNNASLAVDAVVVFAGPPCNAYSAAAVPTAQAALKRAQQQQETALLRHTAASVSSAAVRHMHTALPSDIDLQSCESALSVALEVAAEAAARSAARVLRADSLVKTFLSFYKAVELECLQGHRPCFLVMENPYSSPDKSLWNRPFMREHLLHLPDTPAGIKAAHTIGGFSKARGAWLRPVWQNWCTWGAQYPSKPTIIYTNLPQGTLTDRRCKDHCQRPDKTHKAHAVSVRSMKSAHDRAKWPVEFIGATLDACVQALQV